METVVHHPITFNIPPVVETTEKRTIFIDGNYVILAFIKITHIRLMFWSNRDSLEEQRMRELDTDLFKSALRYENKITLFQILAFVFGASATILMVIKLQNLPNDTLDLASLGGFVVGFAGAFLALAGFCVLVATLAGQQKLLLFQSQETRNQNRQLVVQSFENNFFDLLKHHKNFISEARVESNNGSMTVDAFKEYLTQYQKNFGHEFGSGGDEDISMSSHNAPVDELKEYLYDKYAEGQTQIKNLFKPLLSILELIREMDLESKERYYGIVHNQLSESEKFILFYFYVTCRPAFYSYREYALMSEFLLQISPSILIDTDHFSWLHHPPYKRPGTDFE